MAVSTVQMTLIMVLFYFIIQLSMSYTFKSFWKRNGKIFDIDALLIGILLLNNDAWEKRLMFLSLVFGQLCGRSNYNETWYCWKGVLGNKEEKDKMYWRSFIYYNGSIMCSSLFCSYYGILLMLKWWWFHSSYCMNS